MSSYFRLDARLENEIVRSIGADRFGPYLTEAGNTGDALRLYSWNTAIAGAFLGLVRSLEPLTSFRNRIAHHEPVFNRRPEAMYDALLTTAQMVSGDLGPWIEHHSRLRQVLVNGPVSTGIKF